MSSTVGCYLKTPQCYHFDGRAVNQSLKQYFIGRLLPATLGVTLSESKSILKGGTLVPAQMDEYIDQERYCSGCGRLLPSKGHHANIILSSFGKLVASSPRFCACTCPPRATKSVSPSTALLNERMTSDLRYLAVHWLREVLLFDSETGTPVAEVQEQLAVKDEGDDAGWSVDTDALVVFNIG